MSITNATKEDTTPPATSEEDTDVEQQGEEASTEEDGSEGEVREVDEAECLRVAAKVDTIVATWDRFEPTDDIQRFIKKAIDSTEKKIQEEEEANNLG